MGGACDTYGEEKMLRSFLGRNFKERVTWKT